MEPAFPEELLERLARALCAADGKNADEPMYTGERETVKLSNGWRDQPVTVPRWRTMVPEARRHIAAFQVLAQQPG